MHSPNLVKSPIPMATELTRPVGISSTFRVDLSNFKREKKKVKLCVLFCPSTEMRHQKIVDPMFHSCADTTRSNCFLNVY